jgi:hypothetical protein
MALAKRHHIGNRRVFGTKTDSAACIEANADVNVAAVRDERASDVPNLNSR